LDLQEHTIGTDQQQQDSIWQKMSRRRAVEGKENQSALANTNRLMPARRCRDQMGVAACGKECMGQCLTPVPLRFQSLSSRRKRKTDQDEDEAEEKPKPIDDLRHSKIKEHAKREGT
jgi:hypothetical protein